MSWDAWHEHPAMAGILEELTAAKSEPPAGPPLVSEAEAVADAGDELMEEWRDRCRTVREYANLHFAVRRREAAAAERDAVAAELVEDAQGWRTHVALRDVADAMLGR